MDRIQLSHVKHMPLSEQLPGDWAKMDSFDPYQEGDDTYRYQLAYMAYMLALVQHHYVPAYRERYQKALISLIDKMMIQDVWAYWENTSRGGRGMDPDLPSLSDGWVDLVCRQNIMFSGYLLMMIGLYQMLYRDGRYDQPGSINFRFRPIFRGMGPKEFAYNHTSLANAIYDEFERQNFLGCECEPNGMFDYCNQFPILGFMHYDATHGTDLSVSVIEGFSKAWGSRTNLFEGGSSNLPVYHLVRQKHFVDELEIGGSHSASALTWGTFMHAWKPAQQRRDFCRDEKSAESHDNYQKNSSADKVDPMMLGVHTLGMAAVCASEMGDEETTDGIYAYAEEHLKPTTVKRRRFFPRCDELISEKYMTCLTGNVLLGLAQLNIHNGFWSLYDKPFTPETFSRPELFEIPHPTIQVTEVCWDVNGHLKVSTNGSSAAVSPFQSATSMLAQHVSR
ncbi:hypothetical protein PEBR_32142 [Penicillium brasilianum]|uniref:Linalool dehydratase/isomerase domain-containing protein n=1 Tax=Penicillium brasilianum TaxID=104259 RepID=A0A1S9REW2_PENBI|nr:hypothetical protein PEBR_32142 [Penicillium brasilianum]